MSIISCDWWIFLSYFAFDYKNRHDKTNKILFKRVKKDYDMTIIWQRGDNIETSLAS